MDLQGFNFVEKKKNGRGRVLSSAITRSVRYKTAVAKRRGKVVNLYMILSIGLDIAESMKLTVNDKVLVGYNPETKVIAVTKHPHGYKVQKAKNSSQYIYRMTYDKVMPMQKDFKTFSNGDLNVEEGLITLNYNN